MPTLDDGVLRYELPRAMRAALDTDEQMRSLAGRHSSHRRYWLSGAGPAGVTAMEAALKIKESSYLQAEGIPTEQMLHGPFQCVEPDDLMLLAAPEDAGLARTLDLAREAREIPLDLIVVSDGGADAVRDISDGWVSVPRVPAPFSHITTLIPMHLFAYWLAIERGTNPDRFRLDDERFLRAFQLTTL
jgi:glucosamine--fructose-6-phosphate aminotransferase (isomerizing)